MYYISEQAAEQSVTQDDVTKAVEAVFLSLASGEAVNFPVVRETLNFKDAVFGFKSGFDRSAPALCVKAGGLWPGNRAKGLANHQSTIVLFDPDTGGPKALVRGTYLTALRTAAASALSIRALARDDVETLGVVGAGGQALFQIRAALGERAFKRIVVYDASEENAQALNEALADLDLDVFLQSPEALASVSDVIITVTPSCSPILQNDWVKPGTHLACMGADTKGKQEVAAGIVARAVLFGDEPAQNITIGECQHAFAANLITQEDITTLGRALAEPRTWRRTADDITLFDSTGMGLQDLAVASIALEHALSSGLARLLDD